MSATGFDPSGLEQTSAFTRGEIWGAIVGAALIQIVLLVLVAVFGVSKVQVKAEEEKPPEVESIRVAPVLDELPLLKLGSKKDKLKPKLPDMWRKQEPRPVKRYEESSAPSVDAEDDPEEIPETKLAEKDKEAPPEDAEVVKELDEELEDVEETDEKPPELDEEGAADGVAEGTETDPLKARAVDLYRRKILGWFNSRFRPPQGEIPCEELRTLSAAVSVQVGSERNVAGYTITNPSGNPVFDAKVKSTMDGIVGQQLPPPPPLYPDILESTVFPRLSGAGVPCEN